MLLLHRRLPTHAVLAGTTAAVALGRLDPELVAVEARRHLEPARAGTSAVTVVPTARDDGEQQRPALTLRSYDSLLAPLEPSA